MAWVADRTPRARNTCYTSLYSTHRADPAFEAYFEDPRTVSIVEEMLGARRSPALLESHVAINYAAGLGLGRIVALYCCLSNLYRYR